jgi:secondary thiamine-phosphate synthase enzyme
MAGVCEKVSIETRGKGLYEITERVTSVVHKIAPSEAGLITLFIQHTSASLLIQENADPTARKDLEAYFEYLIPEGHRAFTHTLEGPDDMPAHIKTSLTNTSIAIPLIDGRLALGTWQGIYVFEHRAGSHLRNVILHII